MVAFRGDLRKKERGGGAMKDQFNGNKYFREEATDNTFLFFIIIWFIAILLAVWVLA